jgi:hypothetical protein
MTKNLGTKITKIRELKLQKSGNKILKILGTKLQKSEIKKVTKIWEQK